MRKLSLFVVCLLGACLEAVPLAGQGLGNSNCNLAGTWFGGGTDVQYQWTVVPIAGGRYSFISQPVYNAPASWDALAATSWSGELVKSPNGSFEKFGMAGLLFNWGSLVVVRPVVHGWVEFVDCDTVINRIDFFAGYIVGSTKVLFKDAPDFDNLEPGQVITERYQRMPTVCPACAITATTTSKLKMQLRR